MPDVSWATARHAPPMPIASQVVVIPFTSTVIMMDTRPGMFPRCFDCVTCRWTLLSFLQGLTTCLTVVTFSQEFIRERQCLSCGDETVSLTLTLNAGLMGATQTVTERQPQR